MSNTDVLVKTLVKQHGTERNSLMAILQGIVQEEKFLSEEAIIKVAETLELSTADIYGTASFYTFLDTVPRGKNIIRVCKTIACHMKGKEDIIQSLEEELNIKLGETTSDNLFTLLSANCLGWCHKGPVMLVNDEVYPELTPEKAVNIIREYAKKDL